MIIEMAKKKKMKSKKRKTFYRRIPHFFMGRFKKWAKILQENEVHDFLKQRSKKEEIKIRPL